MKTLINYNEFDILIPKAQGGLLPLLVACKYSNGFQ